MNSPYFWPILLGYLALISLVAFSMYGLDKWKAKHNKWRIPEFTLLGLAAIGGSLGAFLGMQIFRHKTQHKQFKYGVPLCLLVHVAVIFWIAKS